MATEAPDTISVFYINLDRATTRRDWFAAQGRRLGLDLVRISAVEGKALPTARLEELATMIRSGMNLGPGEIGCFLSHRLAWQAFIESGKPWAFIAEDDLHLSDDSALLLRNSHWIPADADVVKAETTFRRCHLARNVAPLLPGRHLRRLMSLHGGSGGYFVSRNSAQNLIDISEHMCEPADHVIFNPTLGFFDRHVAYQIDPAIAVQDLLIHGKKAGFEQSGLGIERRQLKGRIKTGKIIKEATRPFRQLYSAVGNRLAALRLGTEFRRVGYRLSASDANNGDIP